MEKSVSLCVAAILAVIIIFLLLPFISYASVSDQDQDGVPDAEDVCPNTPSTATVKNQQGCSCDDTHNCPPSCPTSSTTTSPSNAGYSPTTTTNTTTTGNQTSTTGATQLVSGASATINQSSLTSNSATPTVTISQSNATTVSGEPFSVFWSSTNANRCTVEYDRVDTPGVNYFIFGSGSGPPKPENSTCFIMKPVLINECNGAYFDSPAQYQAAFGIMQRVRDLTSLDNVNISTAFVNLRETYDVVTTGALPPSERHTLPSGNTVWHATSRQQTVEEFSAKVSEAQAQLANIAAAAHTASVSFWGQYAPPQKAPRQDAALSVALGRRSLEYYAGSGERGYDAGDTLARIGYPQSGMPEDLHREMDERYKAAGKPQFIDIAGLLPRGNTRGLSSMQLLTGTYLVRVKCYGAVGTKHANANITHIVKPVVRPAPIPAVLTASPQSGNPPLAVSFYVTGGNASSDSIDFGDGTSGSNWDTGFEYLSDLHIAHTYASTGIYAAKLLRNGLPTTKSVTITINSTPVPTAAINPNSLFATPNTSTTIYGTASNVNKGLNIIIVNRSVSGIAVSSNGTWTMTYPAGFSEGLYTVIIRGAETRVTLASSPLRVSASIPAVALPPISTHPASDITTSTSAIPTATIDQSSLNSISNTPTVTGTATGFNTAYIYISGISNSNFFRSGSVPVRNNIWSVTFSPLPNGVYNVRIAPPSTIPLANGILTVNTGSTIWDVTLKVNGVKNNVNINRGDQVEVKLSNGVLNSQIYLTLKNSNNGDMLLDKAFFGNTGGDGSFSTIIPPSSTIQWLRGTYAVYLTVHDAASNADLNSNTVVYTMT